LEPHVSNVNTYHDLCATTRIFIFPIIGELQLHNFLTHLGPNDNKSTRIIDRKKLIIVHIADSR